MALARTLVTPGAGASGTVPSRRIVGVSAGSSSVPPGRPALDLGLYGYARWVDGVVGGTVEFVNNVEEFSGTCVPGARVHHLDGLTLSGTFAIAASADGISIGVMDAAQAPQSAVGNGGNGGSGMGVWGLPGAWMSHHEFNREDFHEENPPYGLACLHNETYGGTTSVETLAVNPYQMNDGTYTYKVSFAATSTPGEYDMTIVNESPYGGSWTAEHVPVPGNEADGWWVMYAGSTGAFTGTHTMLSASAGAPSTVAVGEGSAGALRRRR